MSSAAGSESWWGAGYGFLPGIAYRSQMRLKFPVQVQLFFKVLSACSVHALESQVFLPPAVSRCLKPWITALAESAESRQLPPSIW